MYYGDELPEELRPEASQNIQKEKAKDKPSKDRKANSELHDLVGKANKTDSEAASSFLPTHAHSRVEEPLSRTKSLLYFQKKIPMYSNESHIDRAIANRLKNLKRMDVQEVREPKLAIKQQTIVNKTQTALSISIKNSPASSLRDQDLAEIGQNLFTRFVYVLIFDRVIFAGSNVVSWCVFVKPKDVKLTSISNLN